MGVGGTLHAAAWASPGRPSTTWFRTKAAQHATRAKVAVFVPAARASRVGTTKRLFRDLHSGGFSFRGGAGRLAVRPAIVAERYCFTPTATPLSRSLRDA